MIRSVVFANLAQSEAEFQTDLLLWWAGLTVIAAILVPAFTLRSWKIATIAVFFVLLYTVLLRPWMFLVPIAADASEDPWSMHWSMKLQRLAIGWVIVAVTALASLVLGLTRFHRNTTRKRVQTASNTARSQSESPLSPANVGVKKTKS